jgi:hypothetical protein
MDARVSSGPRPQGASSTRQIGSHLLRRHRRDCGSTRFGWVWMWVSPCSFPGGAELSRGVGGEVHPVAGPARYTHRPVGLQVDNGSSAGETHLGHTSDPETPYREHAAP